MTVRNRIVARLLVTGGLLAAATLVGAASCDQNKPSPTGVPDQPIAAADAGDTKVEPAARPVDVGPPAPAIFMMSGLKGYTEPCGCTLDVMLGGIDRVVAFVDDARKLHPSSDIIDAGDLFFESTAIPEHEVAAEKARVDVIVEGAKRMGLRWTVPGERDFALGAAFYRKRLEAAELQAFAANLEVDGRPLPAAANGKLGDVEVLYVGVVDPVLFEGLDEVKVTDPVEAVKAQEKAIAEAPVSILVAHGDLPFAKKVMQSVPGFDFALVGHGPRETDQVDAVGDGYTLEPYDQGRYLGVLKLWRAGEGQAPFANARTGSKSELEKVERQIEHVNKNIERLPPAKPGEEPEMLKTLRQRLSDLTARRDEIKAAAVEVPAEGRAFLWRSIALRPELREDEAVKTVREAYNRKLEELNASVDRPIPPVADGESFYVGSQECTSCHAAAAKFWEGTHHAGALATLQERHKAFDHKCVGCHVVGYEKPGGSVIGKLTYEATIPLADGKTKTAQKDLRNVGCEACHGPGSAHVAAPTSSKSIIGAPDAAQCGVCHVPEHSPRFVFDTYVKEITGPGHVLSSQ